jgi:hypothetical protein
MMDPAKAVVTDLADMHKCAIQRFCTFCAELHFTEHLAEPLIPRSDRSLLFTNSTVIPLKSLIMAGDIPTPGIYISQPCLRTHNLKYLHEEGTAPGYMSYFRMVAVTASPSTAPMLAGHVARFLVEKEGIAGDRLVLRCLSTEVTTRSEWLASGRGVSVDCDSMPPDYYRWRYGVSGMEGRGATIAVRFKDGSLHDFGNIVSIQVRGRLSCIEAGYGIETMLSRKYECANPFQMGIISSVMPYRPNAAWLKFQDCVALGVVLGRLNLLPGTGGRKHVMKLVIQGISDLSRRFAVSYDELRVFLEGFERVEFGSVSSVCDRIITAVRHSDFVKRVE